MDDNTDGGEAADPDSALTAEFSIDQRVRVRPGTPEEKWGVIVEDFGADAGYPVEVGDTRIVDPSRRWAVALDDGGLEFVDTDDLAAGDD
ncbi:hypothetical protein ACQI4F_21365 [Mycolicibacterium vaccae]|uniref:hypothetical protein n=1 Tax=Mycolicibacterium vaccae TaxID=1810 RepID=UPI003CF5F690